MSRLVWDGTCLFQPSSSGLKAASLAGGDCTTEVRMPEWVAGAALNTVQQLMRLQSKSDSFPMSTISEKGNMKYRILGYFESRTYDILRTKVPGSR